MARLATLLSGAGFVFAHRSGAKRTNSWARYNRAPEAAATRLSTRSGHHQRGQGDTFPAIAKQAETEAAEIASWTNPAFAPMRCLARLGQSAARHQRPIDRVTPKYKLRFGGQCQTGVLVCKVNCPQRVPIGAVYYRRANLC